MAEKCGTYAQVELIHKWNSCTSGTHAQVELMHKKGKIEIKQTYKASRKKVKMERSMVGTISYYYSLFSAGDTSTISIVSFREKIRYHSVWLQEIGNS